MNYYLPPLLLTLAALTPLLRARQRHTAANTADNRNEQRALIAAWREQNTADPANQDEHDYRLYHALKNLRDGKAARAARPPLAARRSRLPAWRQSESRRPPAHGARPGP